jgi:hypothetical protein
MQFDGSPEHTATDCDDAAADNDADADANDPFARRAVWMGGGDRTGAGSGEGSRIWKIVPIVEVPLEFEFCEAACDLFAFRRFGNGMGGWYAGRLSKMEDDWSVGDLQIA